MPDGATTFHEHLMEINRYAQTPFSLFYRLPAIGYSFSMQTWSLRSITITFARECSAGLVWSAEHLLMLVAALTPRFMNSMRALPLMELISTPIPRTRAISTIWGSVSSACFSITDALGCRRSISAY